MGLVLSHVPVSAIPHCYPEWGGKYFKVLFKPVEVELRPVVRKVAKPNHIRSKREKSVERQSRLRMVWRGITALTSYMPRGVLAGKPSSSWDPHEGRSPSTTNLGSGKRSLLGRRVPESLAQEIYAELCANSRRGDDTKQRILPTRGIQVVAGIRIGKRST